MERYNPFSPLPKPGAEFAARMEDILDVYQRPYDPLDPEQECRLFFCPLEVFYRRCQMQTQKTLSHHLIIPNLVKH